MSLKVLTSKLRRPEAKPAVDTSAIERAERAERAALAARAQADRAQKEVEASKAEAIAAQKARDAQLLDSTLSSAAAKARVLNPAQVVALTRSSFELVEGKVRPRDKPDADVDTYLGEWLASPDGKHFLPAVVPGGGSGAPGTTTPPKGAAPHDLTTSKGMTDYAREREQRAKRN